MNSHSVSQELLKISRELTGGNGLTREQIDEVKGDMNSPKWNAVRRFDKANKVR
jgi:hypothetical protein